MRIDVLTLFPEACDPFFAASILGRAQKSGRVILRCHNIRDYSTDPHKKVDDRPFGGGPGMVLMCQPIFDAVEAIEKLDANQATRILLTPQGQPFNQRMAMELATTERLMLIAGHYEGFDERIRRGLSPREVSIGDYVLSGGEAAAMVLTDAVVRLLPGVIGDEASLTEESFSSISQSPPGGSPPMGETVEPLRLEYPQYTRPRVFRGMEVPDILLNGDHAKIGAWRQTQARRRTAQRRPDMVSQRSDDNHDETRRY